MSQPPASKLGPIFSIWDHSPTKLASDIAHPFQRVRQWIRRDSIPPEYWERIIAAAAQKGAVLKWQQFVTDKATPTVQPAEQVRTAG